MKRYARFFLYLKPCIWALVAAVFFGVVFGASSGLGMPVIFDKVLRNIFLDQTQNGNRGVWYVLGIASLLPIVFIIRAVSGYLSSYLMTYTSLEVLRRIKREVFAKVQDSPVAFFDKFTTGDLLTRLNGDSAAIQNVLLNIASEFVRQSLQFVGAVVFLVFLSIKNGEIAFLLVFFVAAPFCVIPVQLVRKKLKAASKKMQVEMGAVAQVFNENLDAVHEVRLFNLQNAEKEKFRKHIEAFQNFALRIARYELFQQPFMEVLASIMVAVTFAYAYLTGIDFPTFASIGAALYLTIDPIKRIVRMWSDFVKSVPLFDRLLEILDYVSTVPEPANPKKLERVCGDVAFENVSFSYKDKTVLENISVEIPAGTSCALVGESGAGKSTFVKLVMRLYDPDSGAITLDGVNLKDIGVSDLRSKIGSVPQYPVLFNDTVYNNILLARPGATRAEVEDAARRAFAHDFIVNLENGYDTIVGERGDRLSGGQKQRIAIARVLLKNPPIIIFDEATSALDAASEAFIQKAMDSLMVDRTMFVIAHRFSTIKNVKKIIVFHKGHIAGFGSHAELMQSCPLYKELYEKQELKSI